MKQLFVPNKNWDNKNVILIISTGRTGTKFFYEFFDKYTLDAVSSHEPKPDVVGTAIDYAANKIKKKEAVSKILDLRFDILKSLDKKGVNNYVESNGGFTFLSPLFNDLFKNLVVIHIIRNPYDWVLSAYNRQVKGKVKYDKVENWKFTSKDFKQSKNFDWDRAGTVDRLAWVWLFKNQYIINNYAESPNYICTRFEDVFDSNSSEAELSRIKDFVVSKLHINFDPEIRFQKAISVKSNANKTQFLNDIRNHPEFNEDKFLKIVSPIFQQFY